MDDQTVRDVVELEKKVFDLEKQVFNLEEYVNSIVKKNCLMVPCEDGLVDESADGEGVGGTE